MNEPWCHIIAIILHQYLPSVGHGQNVQTTCFAYIIRAATSSPLPDATTTVMPWLFTNDCTARSIDVDHAPAEMPCVRIVHSLKGFVTRNGLKKWHAWAEVNKGQGCKQAGKWCYIPETWWQRMAHHDYQQPTQVLQLMKQLWPTSFVWRSIQSGRKSFAARTHLPLCRWCYRCLGNPGHARQQY